jgi:hypothetical protein
MQYHGDGLTTYHVCSVLHSLLILVKRGCLGGISVIPFRGLSVSGMYVCIVAVELFSRIRIGRSA